MTESFKEAQRNYTGLLAAAEKRALIWLAGAHAARASIPITSPASASVSMFMVGVSFALRAASPGALVGRRLARAELVWRQPRRYAGARARASAAPLRLLRRPHLRQLRRAVRAWRPRAVWPDDADDRRRRADCVLPALDRNISGDLLRGQISDVVLGSGTDRTAHPAGDRHPDALRQTDRHDCRPASRAL